MNKPPNTTARRPGSARSLRAALLTTLAAVAALAAAAAGGWWMGQHNAGHAGMDHGSAAAPPGGTTASTAAPVDPDQWGIPEGEAATRRHIRDGLKAGDTDPVTGRAILSYHDPMVPGRNFDAPAKSPFMDMMLVPRYAGGGGSADVGTVTVSPRVQQNLGLRLVAVERGSLPSAVEAVGSVAWNERDQVLLQARATGFVEKLYVRATLDRVAKGGALAEIYVPTWVAAQEEYLALTRMRGADLDPLRDAARQRMRLAGMDEAQIRQVVDSSTLQPRFTLRAPIAGTVTELTLREGATVMAGMTLARIQGTSTVWAEGEVPESQASALAPGMNVTATSPAAPGQTFRGRVQALLPAVDPTTRTLKARMELANPGGRLVPGMFVQMQFAAPAGEPVLLLPSQAVLRTGTRNLVMLAEGEGRFRPVEVRIGRETGGRSEVLAGLQAGQQVVLSGQFLVDSEASLRGIEARLGDARPSLAGSVAGSAPAAAEAASGPGSMAPAMPGVTPAAPGTTAAAAAPPADLHRTPATFDELDGDEIVLTHPPIPALRWPEMTMPFKVPPNLALPSGLKPGQELDVEFRMQDGDLPVITRIERKPALGKDADKSTGSAPKTGAGK